MPDIIFIEDTSYFGFDALFKSADQSFCFHSIKDGFHSCGPWYTDEAGGHCWSRYLQIDPTVDLTIFDSERTVGGVWCKDRCFPGFLADSPTGLFDYSDLPMRDVIGCKDWEDLPGIKVYEYLQAYSEKFHLLERLRLQTRVSRASRNVDKKRWDVEIEGTKEVITCDKLIIAVGLNSKPNWPDLQLKDYNGLLLHSKDVGIQQTNLISDKVNRVTVYGGCKSAVDTINHCVEAGKTVDWVIREEGNGPGMMIQFKQYGIHGARLAGRWKSIMSPSIFACTGWCYEFFHSGKIKLGNWMFSRFWEKASTAPLTMAPYKKKCSNTEKLMPETRNALFFTASLSGLHDEKIKVFLKELHEEKLIKVHRATITSMSGNQVTLSNGEILPSDAAVFATGWDYRTKIFDPADALSVGSTAPLQDEDEKTREYWETLHQKADREVTELLPVLAHPPPHYERPVTYTPYRLYRHIVPSQLAADNDRSLVFLGLVTSVQTSIHAEISALWGISWMEGLLDLPNKAEMDYEIAKVNAWSARRYLSRGRTRQVASAEIQEVCDLLMEDMGLRVKRKSNWFSDAFYPYTAQDYKGIVQDFLAKSRGIGVN
ncbi:FAD-dependent monooxygenase [Lachnellula hyalina]|uniref:FAD-dependent monooxygenase n=1 Tax=Lachnellula hyalina TaxID=1316788 RepID=A0A8H8QWT6_9HELO|nr:FAD-dependent monooxygenase [Lachnellula hyalina]TVY24203.1 FAD-dependent monooxygenase [Lachnellula hyalina]